MNDLAADPFNPNCPSRRLLDRIGDRWTVLIVVALDPGPQRFGALAARVGGISQKMLTQGGHEPSRHRKQPAGVCRCR